MPSSQLVSPAVLLAPDAIPDQSPDATVASFECAICAIVGSEDCPDSTIYVDAQGQYMRDAQMSPGHVWVCSAACLSQLMFQVATPEQQVMLKRFELALVAIEETAPKLDAMLEEWGMYIQWNRLRKAAYYAHAGVGHIDRRSENPKWITDNEEPAEELRRAMRNAVNILGWKAIDSLKSNIIVELGRIGNPSYEYKQASPWKNERTATVSASIGNVILGLKEAAVIA